MKKTFLLFIMLCSALFTQINTSFYKDEITKTSYQAEINELTREYDRTVSDMQTIVSVGLAIGGLGIGLSKIDPSQICYATPGDRVAPYVGYSMTLIAITFLPQLVLYYQKLSKISERIAYLEIMITEAAKNTDSLQSPVRK